jgi:predicted transcriptional regulator
VDTTIRRFGIDALMAMPQKEREPKIIDFIKSEHGLKVSDRHVRKRLLEARQEQNRS